MSNHKAILGVSTSSDIALGFVTHRKNQNPRKVKPTAFNASVAEVALIRKLISLTKSKVLERACEVRLKALGYSRNV